VLVVKKQRKHQMSSRRRRTGGSVARSTESQTACNHLISKLSRDSFLSMQMMSRSLKCKRAQRHGK
jgi:hypothetical protein